MEKAKIDEPMFPLLTMIVMIVVRIYFIGYMELSSSNAVGYSKFVTATIIVALYYLMVFIGERVEIRYKEYTPLVGLDAGSKLDKAQDKGILIISDSEFMQMLNLKGNDISA